MDTCTPALSRFGLRRSRLISLTPLIDVVFILLVFFMLTSSFVPERQVELAAPVSNVSAAVKTPLILRLSESGELIDVINGEVFDSGNINFARVEMPVVVQPRSSVPVQVIVTALENLKKQGFDDVNLGEVLGQPEKAKGSVWGAGQ